MPAKVAFSALKHRPERVPREHRRLINSRSGTGPYVLSTWERGSQIVLEPTPTTGASRRCRRPPCSSGTRRAPSGSCSWSRAPRRHRQRRTNDFATSSSNPDLQLSSGPPLNVFYIGFNVDMAPFDDPVVRQAIALGRPAAPRRQFYPPARSATQFLPPGIPGYEDRLRRLRATATRPRAAMIAEAVPGWDRGQPELPRRACATCPSRRRGHRHPGPTRRDRDQRQPRPAESRTFIDNVNAGQLPFFLLGWGADYPGPDELHGLPLRPRPDPVRHRFPDLLNCSPRPVR